MHPAPSFHQTDPEALTTRVAARGLAMIVGVVDGRPVAAHTPVLLADRRLRFHLSASNALTRALSRGGAALAVVTGADAYVSPDWYAAADQVPTWNYLSVEIEGALRVMGRAETTALLDDLAAHFEARLSPKPPWTRAKMNPDRFEAMLGGIVGFEMTVDRLEGTAKLSQNKPPDEIARVARALAGSPDHGAQAIAAAMTDERQVRTS